VAVGSNVELGQVAQAIQRSSPLGIRVEIVSRDASSMREAVRKGDTNGDSRLVADYPDATIPVPAVPQRELRPRRHYSFYSDRITDSSYGGPSHGDNAVKRSTAGSRPECLTPPHGSILVPVDCGRSIRR